MKIKIKKRNFIKNIFVGIIALIIVACIINIAPGYKRDKYQDITNIIIGDENVTEKLQKPIYIGEEGEIYLSQEDIKNLLDKTIYYDDINNSIIVTSEVSVACMNIGEKKIDINGSKLNTLYSVIEKDNTLYIPIEEVESVYNIQTYYLEDENVFIIDKLNDGMIKAEVDTKSKLKYKPRRLSKNIGTVEVGDSVSAFYTTSKGWRLVRTESGKLGYVKANVLTNEYILRQDMNQRPETKTISLDISNDAINNINGEEIIVRDFENITKEETLTNNENIEEKIWANISVENDNIDNYNTRTELIKKIVYIAKKSNISGLNITASNDKNTERFIIEMAPRLREVGITTNVIADEKIDKQVYMQIVDYIISN